MDRIIVVSTGLDMVCEVTLEGATVRQWGVLGESPWTRFSKDTDYRKIHSLKPHQAHPNFAFDYGGDLWCTRAAQRDAICLTADRPPMTIREDAVIHDGIVDGDHIYFTAVDGIVIRVDGRTARPGPKW